MTTSTSDLNWDECHNLESFDTSAWTESIENLPPSSFALSERKNIKVKECVLEARDRLWNLAVALDNRFVNKRDIISLMIICAVAEEPALVFGPPGTAKSALATKFCEGLGLHRDSDPDSDGEKENESGDRNGRVSRRFFQYLLHQFTEPDELFGPVDIPLLQSDGLFRRKTKGMITDSSAIFLDEIFRANSAILNMLLSLINERQVYEAGQAIRAQTRIIIGASNHPPTAPELVAFYERFPIRAYSDFVPVVGKNMDKRRQLLERSWLMEVERSRARYIPERAAIDQVSCLNDLLIVHRAMMEQWGGEKLQRGAFQNFVPAYTSLVTKLNRHHRHLCSIDDRKFARLFKILRAKAFLDLSSAFLDLSSRSARLRYPQKSDLDLLQHTWHHPDDRTLLADIIRLENR